MEVEMIIPDSQLPHPQGDAVSRRSDETNKFTETTPKIVEELQKLTCGGAHRMSSLWRDSPLLGFGNKPK